MASNEEVISTLNGLIQTCRDGQEGFEAAADGVKNGELKELFREYARQRAGFVGDSADSGTLGGSLHRGWMDIRAAVSGGDDAGIITECERGEDAAVQNYSAALGRDMPAGVRPVVERQFAA